MELLGLLDKLKLTHLPLHLDTLCEQAAQRDMDYRHFLTEALRSEWRGQQAKSTESR